MSNLNIHLALAATVLALASFSSRAREHNTGPTPSLAKNNNNLSSLQTTVDVYKCFDDLTGDCTTEVFGRLDVPDEPVPSDRGVRRTALLRFDKENSKDISPKCCEKLVHIGRQCSRAILWNNIVIPYFSDELKNKLQKREIEIWNHCQESRSRGN